MTLGGRRQRKGLMHAFRGEYAATQDHLVLGGVAENEGPLLHLDGFVVGSIGLHS